MSEPLCPPVKALAAALTLDDGRVHLPEDAAARFRALTHEDERAVATDLVALIARLMREGEGTAPAVASLTTLAAPLLE